MTVAGPNKVHEELTREVEHRLGHRRLSKTWAKVEIVLGLVAVAVGLFLGQASVTTSWHWEQTLGSLALFVLGGYLVLAGHRSHLYQSNNEHLLLLIQEIRQLKGKDTPT